jgi:hypothetical protein
MITIAPSVRLRPQGAQPDAVRHRNAVLLRQPEGERIGSAL